jgi:hypothetical protein
VAYDANVDGRTDGGVDSQWLSQVLGYYIPSVERAKATASSADDNFGMAYTHQMRGTLMVLLRATSDESLAPVRSALVTYILHHREMPPLQHVCPNLYRSEWTSMPQEFTIEEVHAQFATSYATLMQMTDDAGDAGETAENSAAARVCLVATDARFVHALLYNAPELVDWVFQRPGRLFKADFRSAATMGRKLAQSFPHRFWLPFVRAPHQQEGQDGALTICMELSAATGGWSPRVTLAIV